MTWKVIGAFFASLVSRLATFLGAYWLGKTAGENKALKREIEQGRKDVERASEAKRAEENVRRMGDDVLNSELQRFSRKPSAPRLD